MRAKKRTGVRDARTLSSKKNSCALLGGTMPKIPQLSSHFRTYAGTAKALSAAKCRKRTIFPGEPVLCWFWTWTQRLAQGNRCWDRSCQHPTRHFSTQKKVPSNRGAHHAMHNYLKDASARRSAFSSSGSGSGSGTVMHTLIQAKLSDEGEK